MIKLFTIRDVKLSVYDVPFASKSEITAARSLKSQMIYDPRCNRCTFAVDYELFCLGEFNDITGKLETYDQPKFIISLLHIKNELEDELNKNEKERNQNGKN